MPLLVVPNPLLMDNHQAELGDHLAKLNVLVGAGRALRPRSRGPFSRGPDYMAHSGARLALPNNRPPQACAAPADLLAGIQSLDPSKLSQYVHGSPAGIVQQIDALMGVA